MAIEDLKEQGVLLPERQWGTRSLASPVSLWALVPALVGALGGLVMMAAGDGRALTWLGMATFLVALLAVTLACDRAVRRRRGTEVGKAGSDPPK